MLGGTVLCELFVFVVIMWYIMCDSCFSYRMLSMSLQVGTVDVDRYADMLIFYMLTPLKLQ